MEHYLCIKTHLVSFVQPVRLIYPAVEKACRTCAVPVMDRLSLIKWRATRTKNTVSYDILGIPVEKKLVALFSLQLAWSVERIHIAIGFFIEQLHCQCYLFFSWPTLQMSWRINNIGNETDFHEKACYWIKNYRFDTSFSGEIRHTIFLS